MRKNFPVRKFQLQSRFPHLAQIAEPPTDIWIEGAEDALGLLELLPDQGLAVVGTRKPTLRSLAHTRSMLHDLAGSPLIIVSGLATGIDAAAHEAAIEAGLPTIGVIACSIERHYPEDTLELRGRILENGGLVISETAPGEIIYPSRFHRRNRLIAGWSQATWVVEAPESSGALNTASWARKQHRTTFVTPSYPGERSMQGCFNLADRIEAIPLWSHHWLGQVWNEFSTWIPRRLRRPSNPHSSLASVQDPGERELAKRIFELHLSQGGARVSELLDWAGDREWDPPRLFLALQNLVQGGLIVDKNGLLLKNRGACE